MSIEEPNIYGASTIKTIPNVARSDGCTMYESLVEKNFMLGDGK